MVNPVETTRNSALRDKAVAALEFLVGNSKTPPNVRAMVARTLLELVGAIGPRSKGEQSQDVTSLEPEHLTLEAINRELARLNGG